MNNFSVRILNPHDANDASEIARLRAENYSFIDTYDQQIVELMEIRDPKSVGE
jgi:hypothetical protein